MFIWWWHPDSQGKTQGVKLKYVLADKSTHSAAARSSNSFMELYSNPHPGGQVPSERPATQLLSERLQQLHWLWGRQLD